MKTLETNRQLTPHFSLREMTASGTAVRLHIANIPSETEVENLRRLCEHVLEPLRRRFGVIRISSGFRCQKLNEAVKGVKNSQHLKGEAADIHVSSMQQARQMFDFIRQHTDFDQLLLERRLNNGCCWLHVSYREGRLRHDARFLTV